MVLPVKMTEHIFVALISGSEDHKLNCILAHFIHHICNKIKALLVCETGYDSDHHYLWINLKSQVFLKLKFIFYFFLAEITGVVILSDKRICFRIKYIIVNSVYNSSQAVGSGAHQPIQALSVKRRFNFFCVCITYSSYRIRKNNSALQEIGVSVCFQFIWSKIIIRKTCDLPYCFYIPYSLEFQVMDSHNCADPSEKFILLERIMKIHRNKTCLPVMTMDHIRAKTDHRKYGKNRF